MRLRCTALFACSMLLPCPSPADDHLVSPQQIQSLLTGAAAERRQNIATLERTLSTPAAEQAAGRVGADLGRVRQALPALTDAEARDLAVRAAALDRDPAAGLLGTVTDLLVLVLLVVLILLVVQKLK